LLLDWQSGEAHLFCSGFDAMKLTWLKIPDMNWMQDHRFYADGLHVLGGFSGVMAASTLWGHKLLFAIGMLIYAAFKEFVIDVHLETNPPQTYLNGLRDFSGYVAGVIVAIWI
jgi:hypothetical protein